MMTARTASSRAMRCRTPSSLTRCGSWSTALAEIKSDESLRRIPVVVLTTSNDEQDVLRTYDLGVNSFITKPVTFGGLVEAMSTFSRYWFELVELPNGEVGDGLAS
jgi:DNA-binding NarL/FixJ family response regulator